MPSDNRVYIGVDLGGTNIQTGVLDKNGAVLGRDKTKTKAEVGAAGVIDRIVKCVGKAMSEAGVEINQVAGLGIGAPGTINFDKGIVEYAINLGWRNVRLADELSNLLSGVPVFLENDVNVGTWGEYTAGAARGYSDVFGIFVGTGIGGGLVLGGKLYHGHFGSAGEIGYTTMLPSSPPGRRTLENVASRTTVANLLAELVRAHHPSVIRDLVGDDLTEIRSKVLAQALEKGDPLTIQILRSAADYVGIAIANTVTLLSLPCVVLGGGLNEALGKTFVKWVRESFDDHVYPPYLKKCEIVVSKLGDDAGIVGAGMLAKDHVG